MEWDFSSEHLQETNVSNLEFGISISQCFATNGAHLDYDHSKREHIRLFACRDDPKKDFRRRPSHGVSLVRLHALREFALND